MIVWYGPLARSQPVGVAVLEREAGAAVLQDDAGAGRDDAASRSVVDALDQRAGIALLVHRAQVDRAAALQRPGRGRAGARRVDQRAARGEVVVVQVARGERGRRAT